jgi:hypothetical protein
MAHGALYHGLRRRAAVSGQDFLFERTAVYPNPDGDIFLFTGRHDSRHMAVRADIARVDANLIGAGRRAFHPQPVIKMNIGHQGDGNLFFNLKNGARRLIIGHSYAHDLAPGFGKPPDLGDGGCGILCFWYYT